MAEPRPYRASRPWAGAALLLCASLATSSCLFQKKQARVFSPPPVTARVPPATTPVVLPQPPEISTETGAGEPITATAGLPPVAAPPQPEPAKAPRRADPPAAAPNAVVVTPPAPVAPKPAQIYTAEERRAFTQELDASLMRVRQALARVQNRSLNVEQRDIVNRIQTFQRQAEEERDQDLLRAVGLARSADLLARDLLGRLP